VSFDTAGWLYEHSLGGHHPTTGLRRMVYIRHSVGRHVIATDTFPIPELAEEVYTIRFGGSEGVVRVPFSAQSVWRFDGREGLWFGVNDAYRLYHRTLSGDTLMIVERDYERVPVTRSEMATARDSLGRLAERFGAGPIDYSRIPRVKPAFQTFVVDNQGYVWVVQTARVGSRSPDLTFDIFDPEGRYLGSVPLEIGTSRREKWSLVQWIPPQIVDYRLVVTVRDETDVQHVVVYEIEGRH
jgi:hypothetical protein